MLEDLIYGFMVAVMLFSALAIALYQEVVMCKDFLVAEDLRSIADEIVLSCECYICARCLTCANRVPVLNSGAGLVEDFVQRVNDFVLSDKERIKGQLFKLIYN